jgi:hypothetical protein
VSKDLAPIATTNSFAQEGIMSFLRIEAWLILIVWLPKAHKIGWQVKTGAALRLRRC